MRWKLQLQTGASEKVTCAYTQEGGEGEGLVTLKERFQSSSQPEGELGRWWTSPGGAGTPFPNLKDFSLYARPVAAMGSD